MDREVKIWDVAFYAKKKEGEMARVNCGTFRFLGEPQIRRRIVTCMRRSIIKACETESPAARAGGAGISHGMIRR